MMTSEPQVEGALEEAVKEFLDTWGDEFIEEREQFVFDLDGLIALAVARSRHDGPRVARLEAALRLITQHVHYEQDEDGNWHSIYIDKPRAASATEYARTLVTET